MTEHSWAEGYVVDIGYTHGYYRDLAPASLGFVPLLGGVRTVDLHKPYTYYELGCGNGYSLTLHAAVNPLGQFIGADFNPTHVHNAQRLAAECGVGNVRFLEKSFAELLEADLPDAEIVALHGVWSWIGDEHRRQIVEFIRRRLKPGGIAYVSYNCLPGLAQVAPLQRLLVEHTALGAGARVEGMRRALDFAGRLDRAGAAYFRANPFAKARLDSLAGQDPRYLAHEYFNANWSLFYHADVARDMDAAKLSFAGSADYLDNFSQFVLNPEIAKVVGEITDPALVETVKDFARNQVFRRDVYTRGAPKASPSELDAMLGGLRFALARPRAGCVLQRATPAGEVTLQAEAYAPVLDALAHAPMTFDELAHAPETARLDRVRLRQAVFGMAALGNVLPALPEAGEAERRAAAARFNRAVLRNPVPISTATMLASPVLGAGIAVSLIDRAFLSAPREESAAVEYVRKTIQASRQKPVKDGKPVESEQAIQVMVQERARSFVSALLPFLHQLGVVE
jgi:SAM-dependent methyltransferase